jgi:hypothetical protein
LSCNQKEAIYTASIALTPLTTHLNYQKKIGKFNMQKWPVLSEGRRNIVMNTEKSVMNCTRHINNYLNLESFYFSKNLSTFFSSLIFKKKYFGLSGDM